jgi:hypothetical protein
MNSTGAAGSSRRPSPLATENFNVTASSMPSSPAMHLFHNQCSVGTHTWTTTAAAAVASPAHGHSLSTDFHISASPNSTHRIWQQHLPDQVRLQLAQIFSSSGALQIFNTFGSKHYALQKCLQETEIGGV